MNSNQTGRARSLLSGSVQSMRTVISKWLLHDFSCPRVIISAVSCIATMPRIMMDRVPMLATVCAVLLATSSGAAENVQPVNDRANRSALVRNWPQLPEGRTLGGVSGVDIDRDGASVWIADRCGGNTCADSTVAPILKLDAQGRLVKAFGAGLFAIPHGVHVDREGNIWVTDDSMMPTPGKGHQVIFQAAVLNDRASITRAQRRVAKSSPGVGSGVSHSRFVTYLRLLGMSLPDCPSVY